MKALSLKEPWASLIAAGIKRIETRSWRTGYRGPLFIHASKTPVDRKGPQIQTLLELLPSRALQPGFVVCRCVLRDCLPMDRKFLAQIEQNPVEKLCGEYALGRWAWILEQVQPIEKPFPAKGSLGLWNLPDSEG